MSADEGSLDPDQFPTEACDRLITREDVARASDLLVALIAHKDGTTGMPLFALIETTRHGDHMELAPGHPAADADELERTEHRHAREVLQALAEGRRCFRDQPSPWVDDQGVDVRSSSEALFSDAGAQS